MTDYQPKINEIWAGFTPEEREAWWSPGDKVREPSEPMGRVFSYWWIVTESNKPNEMCTPAPCASLWVKMEAWLGDDLIGITQFNHRWKYNIKSHTWIFHEDRWTALLEAVLAKQREGK